VHGPKCAPDISISSGRRHSADFFCKDEVIVPTIHQHDIARLKLVFEDIYSQGVFGQLLFNRFEALFLILFLFDRLTLYFELPDL
jgi:hypothetical protein